MELIDTHLHVIDTRKLNYPWLAGFDGLRGDYLLSTWQQQAKRVGITSALHMEVDVAEADIEAETAMVEDFMKLPDAIVIGAISGCRPEHADFPAFLERSEAVLSIKGLRRILHKMPDELSQQPLFRENIKRLGKTRFPFDLCVFPRQLPLAAALADLAPDVQFVIDHCGVPDIAAKADEPWASGMSALAKRPNVAVKLSGISAYANPDTWEVEDLRPYVEHCVVSFGWNRVVWGSDWPVVTAGSSLPLWVSATHAILDSASANEKAKLFSQNAKRIWKLRDVKKNP